MRYSIKNFIFLLSLMTFLCCSKVASASYFPASWMPPPDSIADNINGVQFKSIRIRQRLPLGDTMIATFTSGGVPIRNQDGSIPAFVGTVIQQGNLIYQGLSFTVSGVLNGLPITDINQEHSDPSIGSGTLQIGAFQNTGSGNLQITPLSSWLSDNSLIGDNTITVADFISANTDIFYGVNFYTLATNGLVIDDSFLGQSFNIINGISTSFPEYIFSNSPLSIGTNGWESASPFSGLVTLDSLHEFSVVPEPTTLALFLIGLFIFIGKRFQLGKR